MKACHLCKETQELQIKWMREKLIYQVKTCSTSASQVSWWSLITIPIFNSQKVCRRCVEEVDDRWQWQYSQGRHHYNGVKEVAHWCQPYITRPSNDQLDNWFQKELKYIHTVLISKMCTQCHHLEFGCMFEIAAWCEESCRALFIRNTTLYLLYLWTLRCSTVSLALGVQLEVNSSVRH
jgi:hypothetical protein